jgi:sulfite exporter TauE/SafE
LTRNLLKKVLFVIADLILVIAGLTRNLLKKVLFVIADLIRNLKKMVRPEFQMKKHELLVTTCCFALKLPKL